MRRRQIEASGWLKEVSCLALTLLLLAGASGRVLAIDGIVEINQARALAGGVTAGDSPGLPVTISEPGSYGLTGNLTTNSADSYGIHITADDVTIDLNGFTISGPVTCSGNGSSIFCTPAGSGRGISTSGGTRIVVRNGTVRGFGGTGVVVLSYSRVEHLVVTSNGSDGVYAGFRSAIDNVESTVNGGRGISLDRLVEVRNSTVAGNGSFGLYCGDGCMIRENVSKQNGARGFYVGNYGLVSHNIVESNEGDGIRTGSNVVVSFNSSNLNGTSGGSQITTNGGCLVTSNTVSNSSTSGYGLKLDDPSDGFSNNVITATTGTGAVLNGTNLGQNLCNLSGGSSLCP